MRKWTCGSMPPGRTMRPVASRVLSPSSGSLAIEARRPSRMPRLPITAPAGRTSVPPLIATSNGAGMLASTGAHRLERIRAAGSGAEVLLMGPLLELLTNRRVGRGFDELGHAEQRGRVVRTTADDAHQPLLFQTRGDARGGLVIGLNRG